MTLLRKIACTHAGRHFVSSRVDDYKLFRRQERISAVKHIIEQVKLPYLIASVLEELFSFRCFTTSVSNSVL